MKFPKIIAIILAVFLCAGNSGMAFAADSDLSKLVLSKNEVSLEIGDTQSLSATAVYANGKTEDVTIKADWTSDEDSKQIASVYAGAITAKSEGTAIIIATYKEMPQTVKVTVTKKVKSLTKDKQSLDLRLGGTQSKADIALTATYTDNTTELVSDKAEWSIDNASIATVVNGSVTALSSGSATITAKYGKQTVTVPITVEIVKRLEPSKSQVSLLMAGPAKSETVELTAIYPDGDTKNVAAEAEWSSDNEKVADVIKGEITAYGPGKATITAKYGTKTATIKVDVDNTRKLDVDKQNIFMRVNQTPEKVTLTATYPDGRVEEITALAEWSSSNESIAYVSKGEISAYASGAAVITAKYGDKSITVNVDVEVPRRLEIFKDNGGSSVGVESISMKVNQDVDLALQATYANGSTEMIAGKAQWASNKEDIVYVNGGRASAYKSGEATITASYGGKTASVKVSVDIPTKLTAEPKSLALQKNEEYRINLIAVYDEYEEAVAEKAEWSVSSDKVLSVDKGLVTALENGTATVTAKFGGKSVTVKVEVGLADKLEADVRFITLNTGGTKNIILTATDSSGKSIDVTNEAEWKSSSPKTADVNKGLVTAYDSGKATITAKYGGKTVSIPVEVDMIQRLETSHRILSLKSGEKAQVKITVTFSDGSVKDVTADAEWKASNYKIVDVNNGAITAKSYGKTNVSAKYGNKSITIPVDVDTLKYLKTDEVALTMKKGTTVQVTATATYMDGTDIDVSKPALWTSSKITVADVKDGIIKATGKGKATITVSFGGKKTKVLVTVE